MEQLHRQDLTYNEKLYLQGISVDILADSISEAGKRITTFKLLYPRFIHSELMTHRVFSRNASSSRAIPFDKQIEYIKANPIRFAQLGINKSGMKASEELSVEDSLSFYQDLNELRDQYIDGICKLLEKYKLHKQVINRFLEPFTYINTLVTSTEWDNFFMLRCHKDAQPEFRVLAEVMKHKLLINKPKLVKMREYHLPFITEDLINQFTDINDLIKISVSCSAQVSYRNDNTDLDKAKRIYNMLVGSEPRHASPTEHIATPMADANGQSRNFRGWEQYRDIMGY